MKADIRQYSDNELSLMVFNEEGLYRQRHTNSFLELIEESFIYNDSQMEVLREDLEEDEKGS